MQGIEAVLVLWAHERAKPGECLTVLGDGFTTQPLVKVYSVLGSEGALTTPPGGATSVTPLSGASDQVLQLRLPTTLTDGLIALWVSGDQGATWSAPHYLNQARVSHFEFDAVSAGFTCRAFGRNLQLAGANATVTVGGQAATVNAGPSTEYVLSFVFPTGLTVGNAYSVVLNNGYGGTYGNATAPVQLTCRAGGADVFGLGVPWGADFVALAANVYNVKTDSRLAQHAVGDGVANDRAAIQAAITAAAADTNGGVVYLPAGTYLLGAPVSGPFLAQPSKVVLKGDGQGITILRADNTSYNADVGIVALNAGVITLAGLLNLSVRFVTVQTLDRGVLYESGQVGNECFLKNVEILTNPLIDGPLPLAFQAFRNGLVRDCSITQQSYNSVGATFKYGKWLWLYNNKFAYNRSRVLLVDNMPGPTLIESNTFTLDWNIDQSLNKQRGAIEYSDSVNTVILSNSFVTTAGTPVYDGVNEGECLNHQHYADGGSVVVSRGQVSSAGTLTLTDSTAAWSTNQFVVVQNISANGLVVAILDGKGMGQWRNIVSNTPTTITVDSAWDIVPDATSRYAVNGISARDCFVLSNTLTNQKQGFVNYSTTVRCLFASNVLNGSGGILFFAQDLSSINRQHWMWFNSILDNTLSNSGTSRSAYLTLECDNVDAPSRETFFATAALANEFRRNVLTGSGLPVDRSITDIYYRYGEGGQLWCSAVRNPTKAEPSGNDNSTRIVIGQVLENNRTRSTPPGMPQVLTGTGAWQLLVAGHDYDPGASHLQNDIYPGIGLPGQINELAVWQGRRRAV